MTHLPPSDHQSFPDDRALDSHINDDYAFDDRDVDAIAAAYIAHGYG